MHSEKVAIVIVTWNSAKDIGACLRSAMAQKPGEIVVVDNASHDDTVAVMRTDFSTLRLLPQKLNTGFAGGCNIGIAATTAPYILLLNPDARLHPAYLEILVAALESESQAASAIGKLVYEKDGVQYIDGAGIRLRRYALSPLDRGRHELDKGQYDRPQYIFGPSGAAALYRRSALNALNGEIFDEELFAYYEDVDLAWRLSHAGFQHLYVPTAVASHPRQGTGNKPLEIEQRAFVNRYIVWFKNEKLSAFMFYAPLALAWEGARLVRRSLFSHRPAWPVLKQAAQRLFKRLRQR